MVRFNRPRRRTPRYRRKRAGRRAPRSRRRSRGVPKTLSLTRVGVGLPSQLYMRHHYRIDAANLTDTSAGWKQIAIAANSIYDPEVATGGGQPTLRDNLFALYNWARVVSVKATCYFYNVGGLHARCGMVYTTGSTDTPFDISAVNDPMALPRDRAKFTTLTEYGGSKTMARITKTFHFRHFESDLFSSVNFRQPSSANPNKLLYLMVGAQCVVGNNDLQVRCEVDLDFTVRWEDPINPEMTQED